MSDEYRISNAATLLSAVADETRLRILKCLEVRPACVCEIMQATDLPQAKVSRHLKILRDAGLVSDARDAQWVIYSLANLPKQHPAMQVLQAVLKLLCDDPQVLKDHMRLKSASRAQCVSGSPDDEGVDGRE